MGAELSSRELCGPRSDERQATDISTAIVDARFVKDVYAKLAFCYDWMFGPLLQSARLAAVRRLPIRPGDRVLEVGIGTGINAPLYPSHCSVTGIDCSKPMLDRAIRRVAARGIRNVRLIEMDAANLRLADESFELVYAAYLISVVPNPVQVLREMLRVCRVGGHVVLLNHFRSPAPIVARAERLISPLTIHVGFKSDVDLTALLAHAELVPMSVEKVGVPRVSLVMCRKSGI
jgi:phosphatidylethanolamine/phosphatidyl-N-methylethanolamine N-methyltransferase